MGFFWSHLGSILDPSFIRMGPPLDPFWKTFMLCFWFPLGSILDLRWVPRGLVPAGFCDTLLFPIVSILDPRWVHLGPISGPHCLYFETLLDHRWVHFGPILEPSGHQPDIKPNRHPPAGRCTRDFLPNTHTPAGRCIRGFLPPDGLVPSWIHLGSPRQQLQRGRGSLQ